LVNGGVFHFSDIFFPFPHATSTLTNFPSYFILPTSARYTQRGCFFRLRDFPPPCSRATVLFAYPLHICTPSPASPRRPASFSPRRIFGQDQGPVWTGLEPLRRLPPPLLHGVSPSPPVQSPTFTAASPRPGSRTFSPEEDYSGFSIPTLSVCSPPKFSLIPFLVPLFLKPFPQKQFLSRPV